MITYKNIFAIVPTDETQDEWVIACPKGKLSEKVFNTPEEAEAYIETKPWDLIVNTTGFIAESIQKRSEK